MSGYDEVIAAHAPRAKKLYATKWDELLTMSGLKINDDGSNNASSVNDVKKYLTAIEALCGNVGVTSARLAMKNKASSIGLDAKF